MDILMSNPENRNSSIAWLIGGMLGLPLLYFLSVGPANFLYERLPVSRDALTIIYFPITWLSLNSPLGPVIQWYADLWA